MILYFADKPNFSHTSIKAVSEPVELPSGVWMVEIEHDDE